MNVPKRYESAEWEHVPEHVRALIENIKESRRGIYFHGTVGSGKTHILYAIHKHLDQNRILRSLIWNVTDLMFELRKDFERQPEVKTRIDEWLPEYNGLLMLDDIGAEKLTDFVSETVYRVVNSRYNAMLPILFSSNLPLSELAERIGDRTASRIVEMCDIVKLDGSDRRLQMADKK
jgi:DNA replication protein DnaC